jgi:hypothetical protein
MIFFCAVNDIAKESKFYRSIVIPSINNEEIRWGITELSTSTFSKIKKDDYVFFYFKGKLIGVSKVLKTITDKDLSMKLFGINEHKLKGKLYWSNIISFSNYNSIAYPFNEIIKIGKYSDKFSIRRIIELNSIGLQNIFENFNAEDNFVKYIVKNYSNQNQLV